MIIEQAQGRGADWSDVGTGRNKARRTVSNRCNFKTAGGIYAPTRRGVVPGPPALLPYFSHAQQQAPLNIFARDNTDPSNRALMGYSLSHRPDVYFTLKAIGANQTDPNIRADGSKTTHTNLWDGATETHEHGPGSSKDSIEIEDSTCANVYRYTVKTAPGCRLQVLADGLIHLVDGDGVSHMHYRRPIAWDENGSASAPNLRAYMTLGESIGQFQVLEKSIHVDDFAAAVGKRVHDPVLVISGKPALEDVHIVNGLPNNNYGSSVVIVARITLFSGLMRVLQSALPPGPITAASLWAMRVTAAAATVSFSRMVDANAAWAQGIANGSIEVGAACANWAQYNTVPWAGGGPMIKPILDYDTGDTVSTILSYLVLGETILPAPWFEAVRLGGPNAGMAFTGMTTTTTQMASQEGTTPAQRWYLSLDYTTGPTGPAGFPPSILDRRS